MELRERIINEAAAMFSEMGIKSVRMDDIAVSCGISKRTLYEIFSDREELIRQSMHYFMDKNDKYMQEKMATAKNAIDEFWVVLNEGENFRESSRKVVMDMIKFYPKIFEDFMKVHHKFLIENNRMRLERGIIQGLFLKKLDTAFIAQTLTSYLYGLHRDLNILSISARTYYNDPDPRSLQFATMLYFRGITTEKGRRYIDENILPGLE